MEAVKKFENWAAPIVLIMAAVLLVWLVVKAKGLGSMLHRPSKFQSIGEFWTVFVPSLTSKIVTIRKILKSQYAYTIVKKMTLLFIQGFRSVNGIGTFRLITLFTDW